MSEKATAATDPKTIDVDAALTEARLANLERLQVAGDANKIDGHRAGKQITADLDAAKAKLKAQHIERDKHAERYDRATKLDEARRKKALVEYGQAGIPWDLEEYRQTHPAPAAIPAELSEEFHRQHYVVAALEDELTALLKAKGAAAVAAN